jgi:hypothetical protein
MTLPTPGVTPANWGAQLNSHLIPGWAGVHGPPVGGHMRVPSNTGAQTGGASPLAGVMYAQPFTLFSPATITKLAAALWTNGTTGSVTRLGLYDADTAGYPTTLIYDAGTFASNTGAPALVSITLGASQTLSAGAYFAVIVCQGAPTTEPKFIGPQDFVYSGLMAGQSADKAWLGWSTTGVTGALPGTFPGGATAMDALVMGVVPYVYLGA